MKKTFVRTMRYTGIVRCILAFTFFDSHKYIIQAPLLLNGKQETHNEKDKLLLYLQQSQSNDH